MQGKVRKMSIRINSYCGLALALGLAALVTGCDSPLADLSAGAQVPSVAGAKAVSKHYIELALSHPAVSGSVELDAYCITSEDGSFLAIESGTVKGDG